MKKIFFTPGPSQLYPTVLDHVDKALKEDIASVSHRGKKFQDIFKQTVVKLHDLLDVPQEYHTIFVSSGTEAMERIIENTVEKKSIHFIQGAFSKRWYDIAKELGKNAIKHEVSFGKSFTQIPLLAQDGELICFTQNETSSGVSVDPQFIYEVGYQYPDSLIAVDIVSSAPYTKLDFTKLDCVFFSVQKLFGLPAGLGVIILSPKALEKAIYLQQKGVAIGSYHNFPTLTAFAKKNQTPETPNVLALFLLKKCYRRYEKKGHREYTQRTRRKN
jgi:phosphoserine aminotransferase